MKMGTPGKYSHSKYIINQKRTDVVEHPPVKQDKTFTKHVYQHSKHYVIMWEWGNVSRG